jgi:acetoin utilization protein AcuB
MYYAFLIVAGRMTIDPIIIAPNVTVIDAIYLMKSKKVRRLPVVDNGKLVGVVTENGLNRASASPATTLSVHEINYLLSKMQVKDIMEKEVYTVSPDAVVEEAALIMFEKKVGGLVVMDAAGKVVGIITDTDIFKTFVNMMGISERKTTRITIETLDRIGVVHEISGVFKELGININSFITYPLEEDREELVIRAVIPNASEMVSLLEEKGYKIVHIAEIG